MNAQDIVDNCEIKYKCSECLCVFDGEVEKCPHCKDSDIFPFELNKGGNK